MTSVTNRAVMIIQRVWDVAGRGRLLRNPGLLSTPDSTFLDTARASSFMGVLPCRCRPSISALDLVAQCMPDLCVQVEKLRFEANLLHRAAGTRKVDLIARLDGARPGGHDDDAIRQGYRFFEVMRDEENGRAGALP